MVFQATNLLEWFPQTKFTLPQLSSDVLERPRLLVQLTQAVRTQRLTLISAPAGSGKTTLLSALPQTLPGMPVAWLALDEQDNDPANFIVGIIGALSWLNPQFGNAIKPLLDNLSEVESQGPRLIGLLINEIIQNLPQPFVLILDDLHWITDKRPYQLLDYLLERLPSHTHLVIATRYDPPLALARLRVRGQLVELRLAEIRFSAEEIALFLNRRLGLELLPADLEALLQHTEGWVAALHMLVDWLHNMEGVNSSALLAGLNETEEQLFDYLAEEILRHQSLVERTFLFETSILTELTPALCEAVSGRAESGELLEKLYRRNLFISVIDKKSRTYRYHDLFKEFLQRKLKQEMPEALPILHKCAAHFYSETMPAMAIQHYLSGEWWETAAKTIKEVGSTMLRQGRLVTLHNWLEALPEAVLVKYPRLSYYRGIYALHYGQAVEAQVWLEKALQGAEVDGTEEELGETLMMLAFSCFTQTDFESGNYYLNRAQNLSLPLKSQVQLWLSRAYQTGYTLEWEKFEKACRLALEIALKANDLEVYYEIALQMHNSVMYVGDVISYLENYSRLVEARLSGKHSFIETSAQLYLATTGILRGRFNQSVQAIERARKIAQPIDLSGLLELDLVVATLLQKFYQGDYIGLDEFYARTMPGLEEQSLIRPWLVSFWSNWALIKYFRGQIQEAQKLYGAAKEAVYPQMRPENEVGLLLTRAFLDLAANKPLEAELHLKRAHQLQQKLPLSINSGTVSVLLAYFYLLTNRPKEALVEIGPLLAECKNRDMPGLILKEGPTVAAPLLVLAVENGVHPAYARELLRLMPDFKEDKPRAIKIAGSQESLSARELEVIRLLVARATNREIAAQLVISEETVKSHVKRILQKLALTSRNDVAARAEELGLL